MKSRPMAEPTADAFRCSRPLPTLGILGGGQLGRMTALAAIRLGIRVRFLTPKPSGSVAGLGDVTVADWTDPRRAPRLGRRLRRVTVESEWAPADVLAEVLPERTALWPSPETLRLIRDKGPPERSAPPTPACPVPDFRLLPDARRRAAPRPRLRLSRSSLKQYRGSYDGYGNATCPHARRPPRRVGRA